jgi:hypothetical protein
MFEKLDFQGLIRKQSLQLGDLLAQDQLSGPWRWRVYRVQLVAPVVKHSAAYAQLLRKPNDVAARIHSLNGLPPKFITVPLSYFSFHFAAPFPQSVHHKSHLALGFSPIYETLRRPPN